MVLWLALRRKKKNDAANIFCQESRIMPGNNMGAYLIILPILGFRVGKNPRANSSSDQRKSHSFVGLSL